MGNLYYGCKKCKGGISIFGHYVGFVKCDDCNTRLDPNPANYKDSKFQKHIVRCPQCSFTVTFESMDNVGGVETQCLNCQCKMFEGVPNRGSQKLRSGSR